MFTGWMSPSGDYFPCDDYQHDTLAVELTIDYYGSSVGASLLEEMGWIRIKSNGRLLYTACPTVTQLDILSDMVDVVTDPSVRMLYMLSLADANALWKVVYDY